MSDPSLQQQQWKQTLEALKSKFPRSVVPIGDAKCTLSVPSTLTDAQLQDINNDRLKRQFFDMSDPEEEEEQEQEPPVRVSSPLSRPRPTHRVKQPLQPKNRLSFTESLKQKRQKQKVIHSVEQDALFKSKGFHELLPSFTQVRAFSLAESAITQACQGRRMVPLHTLLSQLDPSGLDIAGDWIAVGVVCHSLPSLCKSGAVLRITNLEGTFAHIVLMDDTCKVYKDYPVGSIVAVLNARLIFAIEKAACPVGLYVETPDKLLNVATSADYGMCKEERCHQVINKRKNDVCQDHIKKSIDKMRINRQFLASSTSSIGHPAALEKKRKDMNPMYILPDGRSVLLSGSHVRISVPWAVSKNQSKLRDVPISIQMQSKADKKLIDVLAQKRTAGARHIRIARQVEEEMKTETSMAFSVEMLREMGFDPSTGKSITYKRPSDSPSTELNKDHSDQRKNVIVLDEDLDD